MILTAYDWEEIAEEAKKVGVNAFLAKPLFRSKLYNVMLELISDRQQLEQSQATSLLGDNAAFSGQILLVEDNELNMEIAEEFFSRCGASVEKAWDGSEAVELVKARPDGYYAIIFMDIQMPKMDGYEATRQIRQLEQDEGRKRTPIVAMSANAFSEDVSKAYRAGMDDYITKPFGTVELLARIRTSLRHSSQSGSDSTIHTPVYHHGNLTLDFEKHLVTLNGEMVHLTQIEFKLLGLLAMNSGKVLTYSYIMEKIWGPYIDNNNQILRVNMANIRRKIEENPAAPEHVFTEIGIGYRMAECD